MEYNVRFISVPLQNLQHYRNPAALDHNFLVSRPRHHHRQARDDILQNVDRQGFFFRDFALSIFFEHFQKEVYLVQILQIFQFLQLNTDEY